MTTTDPASRGALEIFRSSLGEDHAVVAGWVSSCLDGIAVADEPDSSGDGGLSLLVEDVAPVEDRRPDRDLPVRVRVTYCVVPPVGIDGAAMAVRLLVAAREAIDIDVVDEPLTPGWWQARDLLPRPALRLRTMLVVERPEIERAQRVIEPLVVEIAPSGPLRGVVVDEHGLALPGAAVRLLATGALSETDRRGAFSFSSVGLERDHHLTVTARGATFAGTIPAGAPRDLHIHCTPDPT